MRQGRMIGMSMPGIAGARRDEFPARRNVRCEDCGKMMPMEQVLWGSCSFCRGKAAGYDCEPCYGTGALDDDSVCSACHGTGRTA